MLTMLQGGWCVLLDISKNLLCLWYGKKLPSWVKLGHLWRSKLHNIGSNFPFFTKICSRNHVGKQKD